MYVFLESGILKFLYVCMYDVRICVTFQIIFLKTIKTGEISSAGIYNPLLGTQHHKGDQLKIFHK